MLLPGEPVRHYKKKITLKSYYLDYARFPGVKRGNSELPQHIQM